MFIFSVPVIRSLSITQLSPLLKVLQVCDQGVHQGWVLITNQMQKDSLASFFRLLAKLISFWLWNSWQLASLKRTMEREREKFQSFRFLFILFYCCWLLARGCLQFLEATQCSLSCGLLHSSQQSCVLFQGQQKIILI